MKKIKAETSEGIEAIMARLKEHELAAAEAAIEATDIFMNRQRHNYKSYISQSLEYIGKYFSSFGEDGLLLVANHFCRDANLLQAIVGSGRVTSPANILLLAKISLFAEGVCEKIIEIYHDELLAEGLIEEMKRLETDGQLNVVIKAVSMPYVSEEMARKLSRPFKNNQNMSASMLKRITASLQAMPAAERAGMNQV